MVGGWDASNAGSYGGDFCGGIGVGELAGGCTHPREPLGISEQCGYIMRQAIGSEVGLRQQESRAGTSECLGVESLMVVGGCGQGDENGWLPGCGDFGDGARAGTADQQVSTGKGGWHVVDEGRDF